MLCHAAERLQVCVLGAAAWCVYTSRDCCASRVDCFRVASRSVMTEVGSSSPACLCVIGCTSDRLSLAPLPRASYHPSSCICVCPSCLAVKTLLVCVTAPRNIHSARTPVRLCLHPNPSQPAAGTDGWCRRSCAPLAPSPASSPLSSPRPAWHTRKTSDKQTNAIGIPVTTCARATAAATGTQP